MLAYARGPDTPQLLEKTIPQILEDAVQQSAGPAIISRHQKLRLSWPELAREVAQVAAGLWALGIRPADRVGIWASNCAEWLLVQMATARIGAVLVNVNPAYRSHELAFILGKSRLKALFLREQDTRANYFEILTEARKGKDLALEHVVLFNHPSWLRMLESGITPPAVAARIDDVANIQYTSGTTGSPKGVLLTHSNLVNNAFLVGHTLKITARDSLCAPVPLYHCFGLVMGWLMCVVHGIPFVMPSATFDPVDTLTAVEVERCTVLYGVPTMFISELEHPKFSKFDLSSLRTGIMAGSPCPIEVMRRVLTEMHCSEITIAYGQTESSPVVTMSATDDTLETRVSTVGRVMPNTEIKIVKLGSKETVAREERGELCTRGYVVMKGYDDEPVATASAIDPEGWLHTGDIATMRPDGYFHISGRLKDMIIRGGENIDPREVEEFLHQHPKIADAYVVGLPDEKLGETVLAWIQPRTGVALSEEEVLEYCRGRIAHFKVPHYIRFVDSFPMTATGKIQKYRIREIEIESRGLHAAASIKTA